jgi:ubiquinone/menaquinone biosynthesis C-methylase UbiE
MSRVGLALRAIRLAVTRSTADPTPDYDVASRTYDEAFTSLMGPHSTAVLDRLRLAPGSDIIELACGTGHLTAATIERLKGDGSIRAVDKSPGMLAVAGAKVRAVAGPGVSVAMAQGDMIEFLAAQPDDSADAVVCGWAICYSQPVRLLREIVRVLRPGGWVAIIETRADALSTVRQAFETVVVDEPKMLTALVRVELPRGVETLRTWFHRAGLETVEAGEGEQEWPCRSAADALGWLERSGAGAGFRDSFDMTREREVRERLLAALTVQSRRPEGLRLIHPFVWGVAGVVGTVPAVRRS